MKKSVHLVRWALKQINKALLHNDNFTILCNSCIGGVIYNKLGARFCSPTINMGMSDKSFLKFIQNLDYYMSCQLIVFDNDTDEKTYYSAKLGDLDLIFGHYSSKLEIEEKWEKRKKRINRDNLFIIMSDRPSGDNKTEITHDDLLALKGFDCSGKVVFSTKDYDDIDFIIRLPKDPAGDYVNSYMYDKLKLFDIWRWELRFFYGRWLSKNIK